MYVKLGGIRMGIGILLMPIQIRIGIKTEIWIRIRIDINTMSTHTVLDYIYFSPAVLRIRIRDPGSGIGCFLTPGSGIRDPE